MIQPGQCRGAYRCGPAALAIFASVAPVSPAAMSWIALVGVDLGRGPKLRASSGLLTGPEQLAHLAGSRLRQRTQTGNPYLSKHAPTPLCTCRLIAVAKMDGERNAQFAWSGPVEMKRFVATARHMQLSLEPRGKPPPADMPAASMLAYYFAGSAPAPARSPAGWPEGPPRCWRSTARLQAATWA